ncbi:hypothetical protein DFH07DRAFT_1055083 [Mycena maculata]|uniref:DUF6534 domain-containing protein n=1 Tax=Mycena maculata TaxID=230809 RepID=A0AAD7P014_9AGAR|nr:hypothetical protein DFH07DRAFT_1055083 [Mycena maculata]
MNVLGGLLRAFSRLGSPLRSAAPPSDNALVVVIGTIGFGGAAGCVTLMFKFPQHIFMHRSHTFAVLAGIAKGFGAGADILATVAMCMYLTSANSGITRTSSLLKSLIHLVINRGILITAAQIFLLVTFFATSGHLYWLAVHINTTKLYINTFSDESESGSGVVDTSPAVTDGETMTVGMLNARTTMQDKYAMGDMSLGTSSNRRSIASNSAGTDHRKESNLDKQGYALGAIRVITTAILDVVEDPDTLKTCSLVCAAFTAPSQRIILRSICIRLGRALQGRGFLSPKQVHTGIHRSPYIRTYIRQVTIQFSPLKLGGDDDLLQNILSALADVERLVLRGSINGVMGLSQGLLSAFMAFLRRPSLDCVYLMNIYDVPSALMSLVMLSARVLLMQDVVMQNDDTQDNMGINIFPSTPHLEHLIFPGRTILATVFPLVDRLLDERCGNLRRLRTLEIGMASDGHARAYRLLTASSSTLRNLVIDCGDCYKLRLPHALRLPHLPVLHAIELRLFLGWVRFLPEDLYATVATFPDVIPNVRQITLFFVFEIIQQQISWEDSTEGGVFPLFDATHRYRTRLPELRRVDCSLQFSWNGQRSSREVHDATFGNFIVAMQRLFPGPQEDGVLNFSLGEARPRWQV